MLRHFLLCCLIPALLAGCGKSTPKDPLAGVGGYKLVYRQKDNRRVEPALMAAALRERINAKSPSEVVVNVLDDGGCEVLLPGASEKTLADVKLAISLSNLLKLRIVADQKEDQELIAAAMDGKDVAGANWVQHNSDKVTAPAKAAVWTTPEGKNMILVLEQGNPVDAWHFQHSEVARDEDSRPCLTATLNQEGAQRLSELTARYRQRSLGIIVDGVLVSAPVIQGQINSQARITGKFTVAEIEFMVASLASGHSLGSLEPEPSSEVHVPATIEK